MATISGRKPSGFLLFPWSLLSIVLILLLNTAFSNFFGKNWSWIALVLIIPAAILENFKVGYSTMKVMFLKVVFSLLSFMVVGISFGASISRWYLVKFENKPDTPGVHIPWYVLLALIIMLLIEIAQLFSMLKAVKRELMQFDPDQ